MFWTLSPLAIGLISVAGTCLAAEAALSNGSGRRNDSPAVVSNDSGTLAAAKQTDKELIEKQKTCPVMGQPLGSMGKPVKVVVKKRTVFLCCAGCTKKLLADPDKYLKKLDQKK